MDTISERIKYIREVLLNNMPQEDFGKLIGKNQTTISKLENGATVTDSTIKIICSKFHINDKWLMSGIGNIYIGADIQLLSEIKEMFALSDSELKFLFNFLMLTIDDRQKFITILNTLIKTS